MRKERRARLKAEGKLTLQPKLGAPTKYTAQYDSDLVEHMKLGYSFESFAGVVGVSVSTLYEWEKSYPSFSEAKGIGLAACLLFWERLGLSNVRTLEGFKFNNATWIFNMKNRFGWRDKQPDEDDELLQRAALILELARKMEAGEIPVPGGKPSGPRKPRTKR